MSSANRPAYPLIRIAERAVRRFSAEVAAHPRVEVGGKYVGFIVGGGRHAGVKERMEALPGLTFNITDYLDDGPGAVRTVGSHRGDAGYQVAAFRQLEQRYPHIEHIGSWHSHHPNGLQELSAGDIRGYLETVNEKGHNHDFFFVTLGLDAAGFGTARHFLFVRGHDGYYEIPPGAIERVPDELCHTMTPVYERAGKGPEEDPPPEGAAPPKTAPQETTTTPQDPPLADATAPVRERAIHEGISRHRQDDLHVEGWSHTAEGRSALVWQQELTRRKQFSDVRLLINQGRLLAKGTVMTNGGPVSMRLLYPSSVGSRDGLLKLASVESPDIELTVTGIHAGGLEHAEAISNELGRLIRHVRELGHSREPRLIQRFLGVLGRG
ncbi:hypothetical protein AB0K18_40500 [Nonomuraea sp. NPDC049421]|uniref:hypothetical protein n=1 Tax=Nonomuraea sp. NPDC049421 TaxID=3155275 RepID=UPI0034388124